MGTHIKTILIVGKTGSGKSTLANVLCGETIFQENHSSIRESKSAQVKHFSNHGQTYKIIDTPGFTKDDFSMNKITSKSTAIVKHLKEDLTQVFIVTDEFSEVDSLLYHFLKDFVLDNYNEDENNNAKELITFIRTKFIQFENPEVIRKDKYAILTKSSGHTMECMKDCHDILFVNHPSNCPDQNKDLMKGAQTVRDHSRKVLLDYLEPLPPHPPIALLDIKKRIQDKKRECILSMLFLDFLDTMNHRTENLNLDLYD
ncbi:unnamed protein product [Cunninghamella echinulata]